MKTTLLLLQLRVLLRLLTQTQISLNTPVLTDLLSTAAIPIPTASVEEPTSSHSLTSATVSPIIPATQSIAVPPSEPSTTVIPRTVCMPTKPSTPAQGPATIQPSRNAASAFDSTDSPDKDISVGTPSPPRRKCNNRPDNFFLGTTPTTLTDSTAISTRSKTTKKPKKTNDPSLVKNIRRKKSTEARRPEI
nr:uncharacterized protein PB18E9.04c-like [Procambarus clarkii]